MLNIAAFICCNSTFYNFLTRCTLFSRRLARNFNFLQRFRMVYIQHKNFRPNFNCALKMTMSRKLITITQYLRPSLRHHPVERWVKPEEFVEHEEFANGLGFAGVLAGPLVRSSYRAGRLYAQAVASRPAVS